MRTTAKILIGCAVLAWAFQAVSAEVVRVTSSPIVSGLTLTNGGSRVLNRDIDCRYGKEVYVSVSYQCATNYTETSTYGTKTNLIVAFQKAFDSIGGESSVNRAFTDVPLTLTIPGNTVGKTFYAMTNINVGACPVLRLWWVTNDCGVDVNCKLTNIVVKAWVK